MFGSIGYDYECPPGVIVFTLYATSNVNNKASYIPVFSFTIDARETLFDNYYDNIRCAQEGNRLTIYGKNFSKPEQRIVRATIYSPGAYVYHDKMDVLPPYEHAPHMPKGLKVTSYYLVDEKGNTKECYPGDTAINF